jgi:hypothetical protein
MEYFISYLIRKIICISDSLCLDAFVGAPIGVDHASQQAQAVARLDSLVD